MYALVFKRVTVWLQQHPNSHKFRIGLTSCHDIRDENFLEKYFLGEILDGDDDDDVDDDTDDDGIREGL